jgi:class 3 adenylate cyclase
MSKSIDDLVAAHRVKQLELLRLGQEIAESATPIVVAFVDLSESTQLKQDNEPDAWLGYVYGFLKLIDDKCQAANGTTVKRIGDELMVTFSDTSKSETFLQLLIADADSVQYAFKIALDAGDAYHFRFSANLADDPYGPVVDRCARIAKLAGPRTVLCSNAYRENVANPDEYISVGNFSLHGFPSPQNLFIRSLVPVDSEAYAKPLLDAANQSSSAMEGYRSVGRRLTTEYIRNFGPGRARPFLARELLNVPKLPYSAEEFSKLLYAASASEMKYKEFYGYLVEWDCEFQDFNRNSSDITLNANIIGNPSPMYNRLTLRLPLNNSEIVRSIRKGQRLHVRGIIEDAFLGITLNYIDLAMLDVV